MADDFIILERGFFEGTMKMVSINAKTLFAAMLFHADPDGVVRGKAKEHWASYLSYPPVGIDTIEKALAELEAEDENSTSPDENGRRIIPINGQRNTWRIVNYAYYRQKNRAEIRRMQINAASERYREKRRTLGEEPPPKKPKTPHKPEPANPKLPHKDFSK